MSGVNRDLESIREHLSYDPETGIFTWLKRRPGRQLGRPAGCVRKDGRRIICFEGKLYLASRLAWFFVHGEMPPDDVIVEHKNGAKAGDAIANLRLSNQSQNMLNIRAHRGSNSRYKGVHYIAKRGKWLASFRGKFIGMFADEEEAAQAYDKAALAHDPVFARPNFPERVAP